MHQSREGTVPVESVASLAREAVHDQNMEHVRHAASLVAVHYRELIKEGVPEQVAVELTRTFGVLFWRRNYWPEVPW